MPDAAPPVEPIPTGLSDEEDAQRYLALRFNINIKVCRNCEVYYEAPDSGHLHEDLYQQQCPRCKDWLHDVGAAPLRRKHT